MLDRRPVRIEMSGEAATVVQAGTITGGVHVNTRHVAPSPARPITQWHPFDLEARRELAALLAQRGLYDELLDRTAKGDEHCAQQLVALAHSGRFPNGERLLAEGL